MSKRRPLTESDERRIISMHDRELLTPAQIARRTGRSPDQVSRILSSYYAARRDSAAHNERKPKTR